MTARDVLVFCFKWRGTLFWVFVFIVSCVTLFVYLVPPSYVGQSAIVIEQNRAPTMRSAYAPGVELIEVLNTEIAIVRSRSVMKAVVDKLKPHERPRRPTAVSRFVENIKTKMVEIGLSNQLPPREKWIQRLMKSVKVKPVTSSNVLRIEYQEEDPEWAQKITNTVTDSAIAHHLSVYSTRGLSDFYRTQMQEVAERRAGLQAELADYKRSASVSALEESQRALLRELSTVREKLSTGRGNLAELESKFAPGHEQIRIQRLQLRKLETLEWGTEKKLLDLETASAQVIQLEAAIEAESKTYRTLKQDFDSARLEEQSNPDLINVRLLDHSPLPLAPVHSRLFYIALGVAAGVFMAVSIALLREYFDTRMSEPDKIEELLGLSSMGLIEDLPRRRRPKLA